MPLIVKFAIASLVVGLLCVAPGCGGYEDFEFDKLDLTPTQHELVEVSLGKYVIPIPMIQTATFDESVKRNRVEFAFALYALTTPECENRLKSQWRRHEGKVRDRVILICRNATAEDLQEQELATLKSHLTDAIHSEFGTQCIRRILISDVVTRKL